MSSLLLHHVLSPMPSTSRLLVYMFTKHGVVSLEKKKKKKVTNSEPLTRKHTLLSPNGLSLSQRGPAINIITYVTV